MPEKIDVTVGICAYDEEKNMRYLLESILRQKTDRVIIKEIIVISDRGTDKTDEIVRCFTSCCAKIKLISRQERYGKYSAINEFLKNAKSDILVLASADTVLDDYAIENLCYPFLEDKKMGMVGARPIPINSSNLFLGYVINLQWYLHHEISLTQPKFGELIAFRNIIDRLFPTLTDEEQIASLIRASGYTLKYAPSAIVYNKGPENIKDFLIQRKRIYAGHLIIKRNSGYEVSTLSGIKILKKVFKLPSEYIKKLHWLAGAILLEIMGRVLAWVDVFIRKVQNDYKWEIAKSTKGLYCNETNAKL